MLVTGDSLLIEEGLLCVAECFLVLGLFLFAQFKECFFGVASLSQRVAGLVLTLFQVMERVAGLCQVLVCMLAESSATPEVFRSLRAAAWSSFGGLQHARFGGGHCGCLLLSLMHCPCQPLHRLLSGLLAQVEDAGKGEAEFFF